MTTLAESPHLTLTHDPDRAGLYATWLGPHGRAATQADYELILQFVRLTRSTKLLSDGLLDQNGWNELTAWLAHDFFRRLAAEGLVALAWVLPRNVEALRDTQQLLALLEQPLAAAFTDPEAAYSWLHRWPRHGEHPIPPSYL